jgi:hypothetical protein
MDQGSLISHAVYKTCKDDLHARTLRTFKIELDAHGVIVGYISASRCHNDERIVIGNAVGHFFVSRCQELPR